MHRVKCNGPAVIARHVLMAFLLLGLVAGCGPRFGGGTVGSYANADRATTTAVVTQRDPNGRLLFVIAWIANNGAGRATFSQSNLLTTIYGRRVNVSLDRRAVYALQADGELREIPLKEEQINALFREMQAADFHTTHNPSWQKEVAPQLVQVNSGNGG